MSRQNSFTRSTNPSLVCCFSLQKIQKIAKELGKTKYPSNFRFGKFSNAPLSIFSKKRHFELRLAEKRGWFLIFFCKKIKNPSLFSKVEIAESTRRGATSD
jgi:hypothetical protein